MVTVHSISENKAEDLIRTALKENTIRNRLVKYLNAQNASWKMVKAFKTSSGQVL